jgi:hypothetical protein
MSKGPEGGGEEIIHFLLVAANYEVNGFGASVL